MSVITTIAPLPVFNSGGLMDITGLIEAKAGRILNDDIFKDGMDGWVQLATPNPSSDTDALGVVQHSYRGAFSGRSIAGRTSDIANTAAFGSVGAIKRMAQFYGPGKYLTEFWVSFIYGVSDSTRPALWTLGLDTGNQDGSRNYYKIRFQNYDEAGTSRTTKWQAETGGAGSTVWSDLVTWDPPNNENKDLPLYVALHIDTSAKKYLGFRLNSFSKLGSLADTPDTALSALNGPLNQSLASFATGLNPCVEMYNRSNASVTKAGFRLHRQRTVFLGG